MNGELELNEDEHVGNMPIKTLLSAFEGMLQKSMQVMSIEIKKNNETLIEIKNQNMALKTEIALLKQQQINNRKRIEKLEIMFKRNNLVIRGIPANVNMEEEVRKLFNNVLKINKEVQLKYFKKIYEAFGKMTVIVEFLDFNDALLVLASSKNLKNTGIYIDKDLSNEAIERRNAMLQLRKQIINIDASKRILIRGDMLKIGTDNFYWKNEQLMNKENCGINELCKLYNNNLHRVNFNYNDLINMSKMKYKNSTQKEA